MRANPLTRDTDPRLRLLKPSEIATLKWLACGHTHGEIALLRRVSVFAVDSTVKRIKAQLTRGRGVSRDCTVTNAELVRFAIANHLATLEPTFRERANGLRASE